MKILYHHRIASKDGQYVHVAEIIKSLESHGHEVVLCEPGSIKSTEFGEGSNLVSRLRRLLPGFVNECLEFLYSLQDFLRLRRIIRIERPDCIYERYNLFFPSGIWAARKSGIPILVEVNAPLYRERSENDGIQLKRFARWSEDYVWRRADYVLPVTEVLARIVQDRGVCREKIKVIPNGINRGFTENLSPLAEVDRQYGLENKLVLGFTGFVRPWHGLDRVLDVIKQYANQDWHLFLVGDGPDRGRLEKLAHEMGILDRLTITGVVDREELPSIVLRFDIALQPDVVEYASPLKMFEYMALGKAILAPDTPNIREILSDDENALLFKKDGRSFEEQLTRLCSNSELRNRLGSRARETLRSRSYYWDTNAEKIIGLVQGLQEGGQSMLDLDARKL